MELTPKEHAELKTHLKKVLSVKEKPFDGLRARNIVLLTHRRDGAKAFMKITHMYNPILRSHRFSTLKYCNLLHMVMRFGDPKILKCLQTFEELQKLKNLAAYWSRQQKCAIDGCIAAYFKLLIVKIGFHENFTLCNGALEAAENNKEWDVNLWYVSSN